MNKILRIFLFLLLLLWCTGFIIPAVFSQTGYITLFTPLIKKFYSPVCHQNYNKSILIHSDAFLVCARCTGIYTGALVISFLSFFLFKNHKLGLRVIFISGIILLIDIILYSFSVYNYSKYTAFFTGLFFGSSVFLYILMILENLLAENKKYDFQE